MRVNTFSGLLILLYADNLATRECAEHSYEVFNRPNMLVANDLLSGQPRGTGRVGTVAACLRHDVCNSLHQLC